MIIIFKKNLKDLDITIEPFVKEQKDLSISFRGSRNQRILNRGIDFFYIDANYLLEVNKIKLLKG